MNDIEKLKTKITTNIKPMRNDKNIVVDVDSNNINLDINKQWFYQSLKNRKKIIGALNKKLDELVEKEIENKAKKEKKLNKER